jgi:HJR/Mrr/RecB family endonuclease
MSGEAWSCFQQLPSGLIDLQSPSLSLRWLQTPPTHAGFKITPLDLDEKRRERMRWIQRGSLAVLALLVPLTGGAIVASEVLGQALIDDAETRRLAIFAGVISVAIAALALIETGRILLRYQQVAPAVESFRAAQTEFAAIDAWRAARCEAAFWRGITPTDFERETAELLAGVYATGQVALTRATNDYGVDILLCAPLKGKVVVQCKQLARKVGASEVRDFAGAVAYFDADEGVMVSLERPSEDSEQCNDFAQRFNLVFWNVDALVAWAQRLRQ